METKEENEDEDQIPLEQKCLKEFEKLEKADQVSYNNIKGRFSTLLGLSSFL